MALCFKNCVPPHTPKEKKSVSLLVLTDDADMLMQLFATGQLMPGPLLEYNLATEAWRLDGGNWKWLTFCYLFREQGFSITARHHWFSDGEILVRNRRGVQKLLPEVWFGKDRSCHVRCLVTKHGQNGNPGSVPCTKCKFLSRFLRRCAVRRERDTTCVTEERRMQYVSLRLMDTWELLHCYHN